MPDTLAIFLGIGSGAIFGILGGFAGTVTGAYFSPFCMMMANRFQLAWSHGDLGIRTGKFVGGLCGGVTVVTSNLISPFFVILISGLLFGGIAWLLVRNALERPPGFVPCAHFSAISGGLGGFFSLYLF